MFCNVFKKTSSAGVPAAQLVGHLDVITADGGGLYLNGSALAAAELTYIDGITAIGTAQASKAVVLDTSKGIIGLGVTSVGTSNTSGVVLTSSITNALQVVAEDGAVAVASGNIKAIKGRLFLKANCGDCTADGILGQVKVNTSITCSADYTNGIRGYLELVGGNTVNTGGANANIGAGGHAVHGWITAADNLTIASGHYLCGHASRLSVTATKTITATGVLAAYGVFADDNLGGATPTQAWSYGLYIPSGVATTGIYMGNVTTGINITSTFTTGLTLTNATLGVTASRAIKVSTSQAAAAMEDGYGVVEIDHTITGTAGSNFSGCALSSWVNIPSGTVGSGKYVCAQNNGVYEDAAATITGAKIVFGMRAQKLLGDTDAVSFPFSLNTNNTAITAVFDVNNATDMGWIDGVLSSATGDGHIPLFRDAAGAVHYVNTYTA